MQLFRWHDRVQRQYAKPIAHLDDVLTAATYEAGSVIPDVQPISPLDISEIPKDTAAHLAATRRASPLEAAGIYESFKTSKSFILHIHGVLSEGSERSICSVYRCKITSIEKELVSPPTLCLKLFDDRSQQLESPEEKGEDPDDCVPRWFYTVVVAERYTLNEAAAYYKLQSVQGSVVPWFYGLHQFTLPDGAVLCGLLMEYIEGRRLDSEYAATLSTDGQITTIQSCRHAVRVLDLADVSQRDWHSGQIMLYRNLKSGSGLDHIVLVDFASTTQTWTPDDLNFIQNYFDVLGVLLHGAPKVGWESELVWQYFGEPDDWDPIDSYRRVHQRDALGRESGGNDSFGIVKARNMFAYISPA